MNGAEKGRLEAKQLRGKKNHRGTKKNKRKKRRSTKQNQQPGDAGPTSNLHEKHHLLGESKNKTKKKNTGGEGGEQWKKEKGFWGWGG